MTDPGVGGLPVILIQISHSHSPVRHNGPCGLAAGTTGKYCQQVFESSLEITVNPTNSIGQLYAMLNVVSLQML